MNTRIALAAALVATLLVPSLASAQDEEFGANVDVDFGGTNFGMKVDIRDPNARRNDRAGKKRSREEISGSKPGETFQLVYEDTDNGSTGFKVLEPEGYRLRVTDGGMVPVKEDSIPTSFSAQRGRFYRFEIFKGRPVFDKKFEAKTGMIGTLVVTVTGDAAPDVVVVHAPPRHHPRPERPAAPTCMDEGDLAAITGEIDGASFSDEKVGVLEAAMTHRTICGAQVIQVLDRYTFSADKLNALRLMAPKIVDPRNNFKIHGAFTFSSDKDEAKKILR